MRPTTDPSTRKQGRRLERDTPDYELETTLERDSIFVDQTRLFPKTQQGRQRTYGIPRNQGLSSLHRGPVRFTHDDDLHLTKYIAQCIPEIDSGGRQGNQIYKDLVNNPDIPWAGRHSWSSWRERYVKNQLQFNVMIAHWVLLDPPQPEALYTRDRRYNKCNRIREQRGENGTNPLDDAGQPMFTTEEEAAEEPATPRPRQGDIPKVSDKREASRSKSNEKSLPLARNNVTRSSKRRRIVLRNEEEDQDELPPPVDDITLQPGVACDDYDYLFDSTFDLGLAIDEAASL